MQDILTKLPNINSDACCALTIAFVQALVVMIMTLFKKLLFITSVGEFP